MNRIGGGSGLGNGEIKPRTTHCLCESDHITKYLDFNRIILLNNSFLIRSYYKITVQCESDHITK